MRKNPRIRLSSMIVGLSSALDLVNWFVVNHHRQVASFAARIAAELGFSDEDRGTIAAASALHDIGAISFNEKFMLKFDADGMMKHAELGYNMLKNCRPFMRAAELIRYHHLPWNEGRGTEHQGRSVPRGSHILHLADRIAVLISGEKPILSQAKPIRSMIREENNRMFAPEAVEAFLQISERECFWLDAAYPASTFGIDGPATAWNLELDLNMLQQLSELFRMIIDFRSPLTATHSKDVAHLSATLAGLCGFSDQEAALLHIAGNLHDLGKLAVPVEILEKAGPLSEDDLHIMKSHSFHTYRILDNIGGMDELNMWAALHHECLDGSGYPFHYQAGELPLGSRIVAVADIISALTEGRSYRRPMEFQEALKILRMMGRDNKLDPQIVSLVERYAQDIRDVKVSANDEALREFHEIKRETALLYENAGPAKLRGRQGQAHERKR